MEGRASLIIIMKVRSGRRAAPSDAVCSEDRSEDNVDVFALPKVQMKSRFFRGFSGKEAYESHSKGNCWMVGYCKESTGRSSGLCSLLQQHRPSEGLQKDTQRLSVFPVGTFSYFFSFLFFFFYPIS